MDYESYRESYFIDPAPEPRFQFTGAFGVTLFYEDFEDALAFYEGVLGSAAYAEGPFTRGWRIGEGWLTLLKGKNGNPRNVEITFECTTVAEAEALQRAFIEEGATGLEPADQLMYNPIRSCPVTDPFGVDLLIIASLETREEDQV